ncbi:uncharacterized protein C8R40DRAFT_1075451, partial [Lentinula edodes]|uniref:uncharacterized protein n=1 Tax=Lentinula edodes TaxID=5353 RepID=UPI001E8EE095
QEEWWSPYLHLQGLIFPPNSRLPSSSVGPIGKKPWRDRDNPDLGSLGNKIHGTFRPLMGPLPIEVDLEARDFDAAHGAHTAKPGTRKQRGRTPISRGVTLLKTWLHWGSVTYHGMGLTPYPLIDPLGRVIGVLAGTPGSGYAEDLLRASDLILQEGKQAGLGAAAPNPHYAVHSQLITAALLWEWEALAQLLSTQRL